MQFWYEISRMFLCIFGGLIILRLKNVYSIISPPKNIEEEQNPQSDSIFEQGSILPTENQRNREMQLGSTKQDNVELDRIEEAGEIKRITQPTEWVSASCINKIEN